MFPTLTSAFVALILFAAGEARSAELSVQGACTSAEQWDFSGDFRKGVPAETLKEFALFLRSTENSFRGFSEGLALGSSTSSVAIAFSQYWMARAFYKAGVYGPAIVRFNQLLETPPTPATVPVQLAAMSCLLRIHEAYPTPVFSEGALGNLPAYFNPGLFPRASLPILWEAGVHLVMRQLRNGVKHDAVASTLKLLKEAGHYEAYAKAAWAVAQDRTEEAGAALSVLVSAADLPPFIRERRNELRLLLARNLYDRGRHSDAAKTLDSVGKQDNSFVHALNLRSWVELARENYSESVGASFGLQSSTLKNTFAPEASLVAAISFHELCQFPSARRTIGTFKKSYERSYQWLRAHAVGRPKPPEPLYPRVAAYLRGEGVDVPEKLLSEWIRSPSFLRNQQAINVSFAQTKRIPDLIGKADDYLAAHAAVIAAYIESADENVLQAASDLLQPELPPTEDEPPDERKPANTESVIELQNAGLLQDHLTEALPLWKAELAACARGAFRERHQLMERIETEFWALNSRMLAQLEDVRMNAEILEAETYERASGDLVWQSANNDFARRDVTRNDKPIGWAVARGKDGREEVWEDELGAVKASLQSQCPKTFNRRSRL